MPKPISLSAARADRTGDCRLWSAEDMLEQMLADIRAGKIAPARIAVHYFEDLPSGGWEHGYSVAGITYPEHLALLDVAKAGLLDDWRA